jgi:HK97 family phage portal protein
MSLADRVSAQVAARREISRSDPVSMEEFGYLLGRGRGGGMTKSGVSVGPMRALGLSSWWRGTRYLSETVSSLPVHTYRDIAGTRTQRADPSWLKKPDTEMPWLALVEHWMMSELHRGNAYAYKLRNEVAQVTGLRAIHPDRVRVGQASNGTKVFKVDNQEIGYTSREILHIPSLSYNGVTGLDPLSVMAEGLGLAVAADEFAQKSFGQGSHLQAYLSIPEDLTTEQCDALLERWERFHSGFGNGKQFGVVANGAEYKTISLTPSSSS